MNTLQELQNHLGPVEWAVTGVRGYVRCPGADKHTSPTKPRDTLIYMDKVPTVFCVHHTCKDVVKEFNRVLRAALRESGAWSPPPLTPEQVEAQKLATDRQRQARRLHQARESVLREYAWTPEQIAADSPAETKDGWRGILSLFALEDYLWMGRPEQSGRSENCLNFRTRHVWQTAYAAPPAPFICANPFHGGSISRSTERLASRRHMVVECDTLDPDPVVNRQKSGAVFKYILAVRPNLKLRAVVDAGNKSLHGWFTYDEDACRWASTVLPVLGVDPATLRPTQPVRVPGWFRQEKGHWQTLLYLNP